MSKISNEKKEKIMADIVAILYQKSPKPLFVVDIARSLARDEEFIKNLLNDLKSKNLVIKIKKNPKGIDYKRRSRWRLSDKTYQVYKANQPHEL